MKTRLRRFGCFTALAFTVLSNSACVIILGDGSSGGVGGEGTTGILPPPETPRGESVELTSEQQRKKDEADAHIANVIYQGRPIEKTVQGYSGMLYDYVNIPPPDVPAPDFLSLLPSAPLDGVTLGLTEVEKYPELWGPVGATVFVRPDFSKYIMEDTGATSIQDWIDNYQIPAIPDDPNRLYAGLNIPQPNVGLFARINQFNPVVEEGSFSVIELAVSCPAEGPHTEMIGILLGVDRANYHVAPEVRLHIEYWRWVDGQRVGGYDKSGMRFEEFPIRPTDVGATLEYFSVPGGAQWEHALLMIMAPNGDWWFSYNYEVLGRFPASVFTTLNKGACAAHVYGEVYNPNPQNGWVKTEMGSGQFSTGAPDNGAWARQIRYFDATWAFANEPQTDNSVYWSKPYATECYDRSPLTYQGSAGPIMLLGGPGGLDPVCAQKKPSP